MVKGWSVPRSLQGMTGGGDPPLSTKVDKQFYSFAIYSKPIGALYQKY